MKQRTQVQLFASLARLLSRCSDRKQILEVIKFNDGTSGFKNLLGFVLRCAI